MASLLTFTVAAVNRSGAGRGLDAFAGGHSAGAND